MARTSVLGKSSEAQPGFRREVGLMALMFISLGSIIGSGWLLGASAAVNSAGRASILSWVIAGVITTLLALVHSELGAAYPLAGSTARWPQLAFGSLGGFTAGWVSWLQAVAVGPIEVEATLTYLNDPKKFRLIKDESALNHNTLTHSALTNTGFAAAAALMLLFTVINIFGVRWLAESNRIVVLWKVAVPVLTVGALMVSFRSSNFTALGDFAPKGVHGVFAALPLGVLFALNGFEQATQIAGEARDPQRNVPRAVIGAVAIGVVLYLALEVALIGALNPGKLGQGNPLGDVGLYTTLANSLGLGWLAAILYIDAFVSPADAGLIYVGASARLSYALGHAGYVPRGFSRISNRGVPYISIILAFVVGLIILLPLPSWLDLVSLVTAATVIMYAFAPVTLLALRKADPHRIRPYRLSAAPVLAPLAFIGANEIISWTPWAAVEALMLVIIAGYLVFGISYALGGTERPPLDSRSLAWILPWFTGLAVISRLGQYGGTGVIPVWIDLGVVAAFSLVIFYLAVWLRLPSQLVTATVAVDQTVDQTGAVDYLLLPRRQPQTLPSRSLDLPFADGVIRQIRYGQDELAVLDASVQVVAVNWTTRVAPAVFVSETDHMFSLDANMRAILSFSSNPELRLTTMSALRDMLVDKTFDTACKFVRLDLSTTQSAFWELLPGEGLAVVGFGTHTSSFSEETVGLVGHLLAATATPAVNFDEVLSSLRELARQYSDHEHPYGTGAPE